MHLPFCPCRSALPPARPLCSPGLTGLLIAAFTPPPREASPGPLLPQPRTHHPHPAVSGWAHCRNNEDKRVFVTTALSNDAVVTANSFSTSFPGRGPPSHAQLPGPRGERRAQASTPPTVLPPGRLTVKPTNQRHGPAFPHPPARSCCVIRRVTSGAVAG